MDRQGLKLMLLSSTRPCRSTRSQTPQFPQTPQLTQRPQLPQTPRSGPTTQKRENFVKEPKDNKGIEDLPGISGEIATEIEERSTKGRFDYTSCTGHIHRITLSGYSTE